MRHLRTDVFVDGDRFEAGTAEVDLPEGVSIPNPAAWEGESEVDPSRITEPPPPAEPDDGDEPSDDDEDEVVADKPAPRTTSRRRTTAAPRRRPSAS